MPKSIIELVGRQWLKNDQPEVLRLLGDFCLEDEAYRERVLRCVVGLAGRDMSQLLHFLECAREDPRNIICWYEHAEESRKQFLRNDSYA
jgi:hypothetical protein